MRTLVDDIFAATYHPQRVADPYMGGPTTQRQTAAKIRDVLRGAQRYFVEDDAIRAAATLGVQHPDVLLAMLPRARLPAPKMWIEWSQRAVLDELDQTIEPDAPQLIGAYLEEVNRDGFPLYRITEMGLDEKSGLVSPNPTSILYSLDSPVVMEPFVLQDRSAISRLSGVPKDQMDMALIGSLYNNEVGLYAAGKLQTDDTEALEHRLALCRKLTSYATHTFSEFYPTYEQMTAHRRVDTYREVTHHSIIEFSGTWRLMVALMAVIQARDYSSMYRPPDNPARRRFVGGKMVPFLQHWRVKLTLPRKVVLRKMVTSMRNSLPRPRHGVDGHWAERHDHPDCDHVDVSETPTRYRCMFCRRARYWVKWHERGDSTVGYVKKDRVVARRTEQGPSWTD